jgi:hypothetical protein
VFNAENLEEVLSSITVISDEYGSLEKLEEPGGVIDSFPLAENI